MDAMNRRRFLTTTLAPLVLGRAGRAQSERWRTFEVTTRVEIQNASGVTRAWIPLPYARGGDYQRVLTQRWRGNAPVLRAERTERAAMLFAEWPPAEAKPEVELTFTVATRDRAIDWQNRRPRGESAPALRPYLRPVAAEVRAAARRMTQRETTDVGRARAIYEWVVDNHPAPTRGARFVALVRGAGVPARVMSGLRVRPGDVTTAQHERAEFHSQVHGWVPVDPAAATDDYSRRRMFGGWMADWVAFNESSLMHPRAETAGRPVDSLNPAVFRYRITAREVS